MFQFITSQLLFYVAIALVLFVPGYFLLLATRRKNNFSTLEIFTISFGLSIIIVDFLVIILGKSGIGINRLSILSAITIFWGIWRARFYYFKKEKNEEAVHDELSKKSVILVLILLFLTIFIKTVYFQDTISPTSTDLGHHMYWSKVITTTGHLPVYEKADIGSNYVIESPKPIADFIIGEHLIFSAIALVSGKDFISSFPSLVLFLVQIMSILAIFILSREIFKNTKRRDMIAIMALFLIGPLYALASPQAKFVSGGVIGNTIGNLFIPLAMLFFIKAFSGKKSYLLSLAIFATLGLVYTHHLSTFVFIFAAIFALIFFIVLNFRTIKFEAKDWLKMFRSPSAISLIILSTAFIFFICVPTYLNVSAIDTAVGSPSKSSRAGITLTQLKTTAGEARFAFAFLGFILLFFARKIGKYNQAFLLGWLGILILMSLKPDLLFIDIPSTRIASYVVFPVAIVAAYALVYFFMSFRSGEKNKNYIKPAFILISFFAFMAFIAADGSRDNSQSLDFDSSVGKSVQTYAASKYLSRHLSESDIVLKDHNYLSGDSWIKLFFMRGYNYPLSRGYFKRYEDETKPREQCTNQMISLPGGQEAQKCFAGTKTNFIMINPKIDSSQFQRLKNFWQVYAADQVGIFYNITNY